MEDIDLRAKELRLESEVKRLNKQVDEKNSEISKHYTEKVSLQEALKVSQVFRPDFEM